MLEYFIPQVQRSWSIHTKAGNLRITKEAVGDLIKCSTSDVCGLRRIIPRIKVKGDGMEILAYCQAESGVEISRIAATIRNKMTEAIEYYSGIDVKEVKVLVQPTEFWRAAFKK